MIAVNLKAVSRVHVAAHATDVLTTGHKRLAGALVAIVIMLVGGTVLAFFMARQFSADFVQDQSDQHRRIKSYTSAIRTAATDQRDSRGRCPVTTNQARQDCLDAANETGRAATNAAGLRYADSTPSP